MFDHLILLDELHLAIRRKPSPTPQPQTNPSNLKLYLCTLIPMPKSPSPGRTFFQSRLEYIVELGFPSRLLIKSMTASCGCIGLGFRFGCMFIRWLVGGDGSDPSGSGRTT